jgi:hypothetical protein
MVSSACRTCAGLRPSHCSTTRRLPGGTLGDQQRHDRQRRLRGTVADEWLVLDADSNNVSLEQFLVADTLVLGRKTYEGLAAAWPKLAGAGPAAVAAPRPHRWARAPPAERLAALYAAMVDLLERHIHLARGPRWASAASPLAPPGPGAPRPRAAGRGRRAGRRSRRPGGGAAGAAGAGGLPVSVPGARPHPRRDYRRAGAARLGGPGTAGAGLGRRLRTCPSRSRCPDPSPARPGGDRPGRRSSRPRRRTRSLARSPVEKVGRVPKGVRPAHAPLRTGTRRRLLGPWRCRSLTLVSSSIASTGAMPVLFLV